jgi:phage tail P2-like protein
MALLPYTSEPGERSLESATEGITNVAGPFYDLWNFDKCPVELLPWVAWSLSIDDWGSDWSESAKRLACKNAVAIHRHKGTRQSVQSIIEPYGGLANIVEWWQKSTPGIAHTFTVEFHASAGQVATEELSKVVAAITKVKPVRSHFTTTNASAYTGEIVATAWATIINLQVA